MFARKLDTSFQSIHNKLDHIMTNQSDFDASLAKLKPAIGQVKSDFEAYKAAANAAGVDLSTEETALEDSLSELSDLHTGSVGRNCDIYGCNIHGCNRARSFERSKRRCGSTRIIR